MSVLFRPRIMVLVALLAIGTATCGDLFAKKGGGGNPGGEDPPSEPPVLFALHRFTLPFDYADGGWLVQEVNNVGELVGFYDDDDGNNLDEVRTELGALNLADASGQLKLTLNPNRPSPGEIEEKQNNHPGWLDLDPFHDGDANSFFNVF